MNLERDYLIKKNSILSSTMSKKVPTVVPSTKNDDSSLNTQVVPNEKVETDTTPVDTNTVETTGELKKLEETPVKIEDIPLPKMNPRRPLAHLGITLDYKFRDKVKHGPLHNLRTPYEGATYVHNHKELPDKVDLSRYIPSVYDQGKFGACVAHSASQAIRLLVSRRDRQRYKISRLLWSDPYAESLKHPSRLYIYYNSRQTEGDPLNVDSGCTNQSACMAIEHYKICPEDLWPYSAENLNKHPPHNAYAVAHQYKEFKYSKVDRSIDQLKGALVSGYPVMIGVVVFPSLIASGSDGSSGNVPIPNPRRESPLGGHSILLVGYNEDEKVFKFINHWSTRWGTGGYGSIPYDFLMNEDLSGDFFVIENLQ